jgi:hypothetical protein
VHGSRSRRPPSSFGGGSRHRGAPGRRAAARAAPALRLALSSSLPLACPAADRSSLRRYRLPLPHDLCARKAKETTRGSVMNNKSRPARPPTSGEPRPTGYTSRSPPSSKSSPAKGWSRFLAIATGFHHYYSLSTLLPILSQRLDATRVAGFGQLRPPAQRRRRRRDSPTRRRHHGRRRLDRHPRTLAGEDGATSIHGTRRVRIHDDLSPAHAAVTILHEAGHATVHATSPTATSTAASTRPRPSPSPTSPRSARTRHQRQQHRLHRRMDLRRCRDRQDHRHSSSGHRPPDPRRDHQAGRRRVTQGDFPRSG